MAAATVAANASRKCWLMSSSPDIRMQRPRGSSGALIQNAGGLRWRSLEVRSPSLLIGRADACWFTPDREDRELSLHHCRLAWSRDGWLLRDSSTNGTRVDGRAVMGGCALIDADSVIEMGASTVRFFLPPPPHGSRGTTDARGDGSTLRSAPTMEGLTARQQDGIRRIAASPRWRIVVDAAADMLERDALAELKRDELAAATGLGRRQVKGRTDRIVQAMGFTGAGAFRRSADLWRRFRPGFPVDEEGRDDA